MLHNSLVSLMSVCKGCGLCNSCTRSLVSIGFPLELLEGGGCSTPFTSLVSALSKPKVSSRVRERPKTLPKEKARLEVTFVSCECAMVKKNVRKKPKGAD